MNSYWIECLSKFDENFVYASHDMAKVTLGYLQVQDVSFHMDQVSSHLEFTWSNYVSKWTIPKLSLVAVWII